LLYATGARARTRPSPLVVELSRSSVNDAGEASASPACASP
jgi:hypothetical protein